ncbi:hypothetical protein [Mucilaginibacter sp.]|jgi:organic hydroperoxide reductase OsmC/OhrA|uniref:hypothetical protein n=1 Tax=Mucilaginibacter sp. TaxID=1882438 RepID=UPI003566559E
METDTIEKVLYIAREHTTGGRDGGSSGSLPGLEREQAVALADAGHQTCPYSKATRGNIHVEINVI